MSVLIECPRCDKRIPAEAAFCRRCGLPLARAWILSHGGQSGRRPRTRSQRPPLGRLATLVIVGLCAVLFAALATHPARRRPRPHDGDGGGSAPVVPPSGPFELSPGLHGPGLHGPGH